MRIPVLIAFVQPHQLHHVFHVLADLRGAHLCLDMIGFCNDVKHLFPWVQRGERVLKHHLHLFPKRLELPGVHGCDIVAVEQDAPFRLLQQPDNQVSHGGFSASAFPYDAQRLTGAK